MRQRAALRVHTVPPDVLARGQQSPSLRVTGRVERPGHVAATDIQAMDRHRHTGDFNCREGWTAQNLEWEGVLLGDVLAAAGPLPGAEYVRVISGDYALPLPLDEAMHALLCDTLGGEPLRIEHGAPWRLLLRDGACFTSVKWVEQLEVVAEPGANTAERIATARLQDGG